MESVLPPLALLGAAIVFHLVAQFRLDQFQQDCPKRSDTPLVVIRYFYRRSQLLRAAVAASMTACLLFLLLAVDVATFQPPAASRLIPQQFVWLSGVVGVLATCVLLTVETLARSQPVHGQLRRALAELRPKKKIVTDSQPMRVIFEFAGGPLDGKTVDGRLGDQGEAERFFLLTHNGAVGQRFKLASDYAVDILSKAAMGKEAARMFQRHVYVVTDRLDGENEVLVRAEYSPRG